MTCERQLSNCQPGVVPGGAPAVPGTCERFTLDTRCGTTETEADAQALLEEQKQTEPRARNTAEGEQGALKKMSASSRKRTLLKVIILGDSGCVHWNPARLRSCVSRSFATSYVCFPPS